MPIKNKPNPISEKENEKAKEAHEIKDDEDYIVSNPNMILIFDKINNRIDEIDRNQEVILDPNDNPIVLTDHVNEFRGLNKILTGIIFKEDGSSLFLYKKITEVYEAFANEYDWVSFDSQTYHANYDHAIAANRMDELMLKYTGDQITAREYRELTRIINFLTNHGYDTRH